MGVTEQQRFRANWLRHSSWFGGWADADGWDLRGFESEILGYGRKSRKKITWDQGNEGAKLNAAPIASLSAATSQLLLIGSASERCKLADLHEA
ncbi:hypothetical protein PHBOTO_001555 [Pseudozyma hubeiensis]|nr:hypothetical protein PHBOTO_001555 [Pseudozyma hubeiensis]